MKKVLSIIAIGVVVFIGFLISWLIDNKTIDYKKLYYEEKILIEKPIKEDEIKNYINQAIKNLANQNKVEVSMAYSNDELEMSNSLKYDRKKQVLIFEEELTIYKSNQHYEVNVYIVDGVCYEYKNANGVEEKTVYNCNIEDKIKQELPIISLEFIFQEYILEYGKYEYGKDKYDNVILLFKQEKELPPMRQYCDTLVIENKRPKLYVYEYTNLFYVCEFKYEDVKIEIPNIDKIFFGKEE